MRKVTILFGLLGFIISGYYATWQGSLIERGFSLNELSLLLAVSTAVSVAFDVPSAMLSDRLGHKAAVLLGFGTFFGGFLIPSLWQHPYSLVPTVIVVTMGEAFIEGAIDAWSADIQKASRGKITNHAYMGFDQAQRLGMILGALTMPTLAMHVSSSNEGWYIYGLVSAATFLYALTIPKGAHMARHEESKMHAFIELKGHLRSETLLLLLAGALLYGLSDGVNQSAFWPRIKEIGISNPTILGFVQAGMSLSRLLGLQMWKRSKGVEGPKLPGVSLIGSSLLFMAFAAISHPALALAAWMIRIMVLSAYFSALRGLTQRIYGDSRWRATIASALASTSQIGVIAETSIVGLFKGTAVSTVCYWGGLLSLAAGVMFLNVKTESPS